MFIGGSTIGCQLFPNGKIKQYIEYKGKRTYFDDCLKNNNNWEWFNWDNIYRFIECSKNVKQLFDIKSTYYDFVN